MAWYISTVLSHVSSNVITNILYRVSLDSVLTFPANDPGPTLATLLQALQEAGLTVKAYEGPAPIRMSELYSFAVDGEVGKDKAESMMAAIRGVWLAEVTGQ